MEVGRLHFQVAPVLLGGGLGDTAAAASTQWGLVCANAAVSWVADDGAVGQDQSQDAAGGLASKLVFDVALECLLTAAAAAAAEYWFISKPLAVMACRWDPAHCDCVCMYRL